jgi:hypothetical protein
MNDEPRTMNDEADRLPPTAYRLSSSTADERRLTQTQEDYGYRLTAIGYLVQPQMNADGNPGTKNQER